MPNPIRILIVRLASSIGIVALAQPMPPYDITITGSADGCGPGTVIEIISAPGTLPEINELIPLGNFCDFQVTYQMETPLGSFIVLAYCGGNPEFVQGEVDYLVNFLGSDTVTVSLDCGVEAPCEACFTWEQTTEAGALVPFSVDLTNCTVEEIPPYAYTWYFPDGSMTTITDANFMFPGPGQYYVMLNVQGDSCSASSSQLIYVAQDGTLGNTLPTGCTACFSAVQSYSNGQPVPFTAILNNCSFGAPEVQFLWTLPDGTTSDQLDVFHTFPGAGPYEVCLNITDNAGCSGVICDTVYVDINGNVSTVPGTVYDCLQIPDGPNLPGTPCTTPQQGPGTWSIDCECLPNVTLPCEAGFWVIQAYELDSLNNPGGGQPIPFELWVWNLSTGGSGVYSFVWDFGDGTTSTDPFPTHVYATSGPYTLCLTMTDDSGCEDSYCEDIEVDQDGMLGMAGGPDVRNALTIRVIQELPTGMEEPEVLEPTGLWPNPVSDDLTLQLNSSRSGTVELSVVDLHGRMVRTANFNLNVGMNLVQVDVEGLDSGIYLLRMTDGRNIATMRFMKN